MNVINDFFQNIYNQILAFRIQDLIDIILISYLIYKGTKLVRETRAEQLVKGILLLGISYFIAKVLLLKTMSFLLQNIFQIGIISLIVLFQPELRRALEKVGRTKVADLSVFSPDNPQKMAGIWEKAIERICNSTETLSSTKTGALIVIEQRTRLGEQIDTGVLINAVVTEELIGNIFFVNTPLHDGAMIVRDGRILAAACFLPKPQKEDHIASNLGARHRAAIGISEISDSITIVTSEETGTISIAMDGQLTRNFTNETLKAFLSERLIPKKDNEESEKKKPFWRLRNK